ncbi:hypothetical protein LTR36_004551 [Oleoguttula mirabilis]|uniref:DUF6604 domain-containing protein n=1 Tax=Oleoguttula mirabilis TaxID=1507867 RepID=A0AAV9JGL2_9PEZI|nr:hypothetical protein LTR36_004551 [Oleoguttula mirabilis]
MATSPIIGRYKLYKAGTTKVVQWLAKTAGACCDIGSIISSLKTKSTKKKKKPSREPVQISTRDLVALAEAIASTDPSVDIPVDILQIIKEVIAGRQVCAECPRILARAVKQYTKPQPKKTQEPGKSHASTLNNIFALLEVEELSDAPVGSAPDPATSEPAKVVPSNSSPKIEYNFLEVEEEDGSLAFELWCLLQDMNDVRNLVRESWIEYSKGEISLLAADVITDTAFGQLRRTSQDFTARHPRFKNY